MQRRLIAAAAFRLDLTSVRAEPGFLYDLSLPFMIAFCVAAQLAAVPIFIWVGHHSNVVERA